MSRYELIEHTADTGIRVSGGSMSALFENAAEALFDILCGIENISESETFNVFSEGSDAEELLVAWLGSLLLKFEVENILSRKFEIAKISACELRATVTGEKFSPRKHRVMTEIKGVTYHGLRVREEGGMWSAEIIFDV